MNRGTGNRAWATGLAGRCTAVALAAACGGGFSAERLHNDLRTRAAFDFNCPAGSLTITDLSASMGGNVNTAGVVGCGRRATYVRPTGGTEWLLNAVDGQPAATTNPSTNEHAQKEANK